jgi:hypothetical protein
MLGGIGLQKSTMNSRRYKMSSSKELSFRRHYFMVLFSFFHSSSTDRKMATQTLLLLLGSALLVFGNTLQRSKTEAAPYHRIGTLVQDSYLVSLHKNHSIEAHFNHIGQNLSETDTFMAYKNFNAYSITANASIIHDLIRYDPGVAYVQHNHYVDMPVERISTPPLESKILRRWKQITDPLAIWWLAMLAAGRKLASPVPDFSPQV